MHYQGFLLNKSFAKRTEWNLLAICGFAFLLFYSVTTPPLFAQFSDPSGLRSGRLGGGFNRGGFGSNGLNDKNPSSWSAQYFSTGQDGVGVLEVEATLADSWHVYSVTQPEGGPRRTSFDIESPDTVKIASDFTPDYEPDRSESPVYKGITIEEHSESVLWTAKIKLPAGFKDVVKLQITGLACKSGDGRCLPIEEVVDVSYAGVHPDSEPAAATPPTPTTENKSANAAPNMTAGSAGQATEFRDDGYYVRWTAAMAPPSASPGETANLQITAIPDAGFHVYQEATDAAEASTIFVVTQKSGLKVGAPMTDTMVKTEVYSPNLPPVHYYPGKVTWTIPIRIPKDAAPGQKRIEGQIAYLACDAESCREPKGLTFTAVVNVGDAEAPAAPVKLVSTNFAGVLAQAEKKNWVDSKTLDPLEAAAGFAPEMVEDPPAPAGRQANHSDDNSIGHSGGKDYVQSEKEIAGSSSFSVVLLSALVGGFILNFMPCVLPVIGLKVMSFVGQSGGDRKRILALNLAYAGGICAVFAVLATLAIVFSFSWGQQFQYFSVRLGVTIGLFAFALSYFNVWEIPVPGMAAGKTSQDLQNKEGYAGAFSKGIFTTLLATPCSGPLLGGVFGATLGMTSPQIALVFAMLALGMSAPYLAIGVQPGLVKFLPKPGPWMETFKQLMAFLFLAAVAYFFYQFADENKFPVFVTLMGVWFGCWIIGQVPNWDGIQKRLIAWVAGVGIASAIGLMAFTTLKTPPVLQWVDYDERSLAAYQADGKTVMVDFSAKWCVNCLVNLETAIDTEATRRLVEKNDVITMYADWTNSNPEITAKLEELNSNSIPVLAIYPANKPGQPIVLRDLVSQNSVLEALKEAGPSNNTKRFAKR